MAVYGLHEPFLAIKQNLPYLILPSTHKISKRQVPQSTQPTKSCVGTEWGGDRKVVLRLYRSLIRLKLDYGSIVYGSARKTYLQILDPIAHQGLRLVFCAFRTLVESLLMEANELPLNLRRQERSMQ